jgi:hypothetical protein
VQLVQDVLDEVEVEPRERAAEVVEEHEAVVVHKVDDSGVRGANSAPDGLLKFIQAVDVRAVHKAHMDKEHLVEGKLVDAQDGEGGVDPLGRFVSLEEQVVDRVVVLDEELLFDRVLLEDLHLEEPDDVLYGHGVERGELHVGFVHEQVIVDAIRTAWARA